MKKLDRFILKSFLGPFAAILLVVVFILMMQFLWLYIDELVGKGLSFKVILEFMGWGSCTMLPLSLPLATLLASMMTVGFMSENNELMAIKAAGISLARILTPIMIMSAIIAVAAFFIGDRLVPKAYEEIFQLRDDIKNTNAEIKIPSGTFYDGIEGYILRVEEQDKKSGMMRGVMVYDHTAHKGNTSLTIADSATLGMSRNKDYLIFTLYNGSNYQETNKRSYRDTTFEMQSVVFDRQQMVIPLENYTFEKSDSSSFGDQVMAMGVDKLQSNLDTLNKKAGRIHDRQYNSLKYSGTFLLRDQLDTAVHSGARYDFQYQGFGRFGTLRQQIDALAAAKDNARRFSQTISSFEGENLQYRYLRQWTSVELLRKYAQALACLILFFIGAPLGAMFRKGGLGAGAIVSVLFFVLYWVVDTTGRKLGHDGTVSALISAFISSFVLLPIGGFLTWKAVNDSTLFNMDSFKIWRRRLFSRIKSFFHPVRIVFMGTPEFAVASLDKLVTSGYKVVGVVTVADKPSGRGLKVNESAVKQYAVAHGIPVLQPVKLKDPEFLDQLKAMKADLFVVVAFRVLPEEVWSMPRLGTFNLHAALLPQYRGAAPINWAVINGEKMTGVTTFMIDKDIDTGGIILRQDCRISDTDTAGDVHDKLMTIGADLVVQTTEGIIQNNVETRVQRSFIQGSEVLKPAPKLTRELCHIDWTDSSEHIINLIRGLSPYPTAFTELYPVQEDGQSQNPVQLKIFFAEKADLKGVPGQIISDGKSWIAVATGDGAVKLTDIQMAGKKRMEARAFLAGFRNPENWNCR